MTTTAIPSNLLDTLRRMGAKPNGDTIRTPTGKFLVWPTDPPMPEAHEDLVNLAASMVRVVVLHSSAVHAANSDSHLSQIGRAAKHRNATAQSVDSVIPIPAALIRLEREHAAAVAAFYNVEPPAVANPAMAIENAECRLYIAQCDTRELLAALSEVEKGTHTPRQRRLVFAWRASPYPLRIDHADGLDTAWRALRRQENAAEADALDKRGEGLDWARLVMVSSCRAYREDSGLQPAELRDLIDVPAYRDSLPLWWNEAEAEHLANVHPASPPVAA